jgi:hypothetical protein
VPSLSVDYTGIVLDACSNNSYVSRLHARASGQRDFCAFAPSSSMWLSTLLVSTASRSS